jgi:hypothetical protein
MTRPLAFVAVCPTCGARTEPAPAEGPGESWAQAVAWTSLAIAAHKPQCLGRPAAAGQTSLFAGNHLP